MGAGASSSRVKPGGGRERSRRSILGANRDGLPPSTRSNTMSDEEVVKIHAAIRWNKGLKTVKLLVRTEAQANCRDNGNDGIHDPGMNAGSDSVVSSSSSDSLGVRAATHNRPAHVAAQNGLLNVLKFLVKQGCDVNAKNATGTTPLHMAVEYNYPKIVKYLVGIGANPDIENKKGWKAIDGIDGIKNPISPDYQLNAILEATTTKELKKALDSAVAPDLDIGRIANYRITSSRYHTDLWSTECEDILKHMINDKRDTL